jgi:hypothetical protein
MFRVETKKFLYDFYENLFWRKELAKNFSAKSKIFAKTRRKKNICPLIIKTCKNSPKVKKYQAICSYEGKLLPLIDEIFVD